jgi:4-hydroxyphenylacetate 3-monooxygenase
LAVKLDFVCGLLAKALEIAGTAGLPNLQARLGEVVSWRNTFWALSDAMAHGSTVRHGLLQPDARAAAAFPVMAQIAYPSIRRIIEAGVASGLIYLNSHARDFKSETLRPLLDRYLRGSGGIGSEQRVKTMKLLWDAIGTEFGGRQALYEGHHMGSDDDTRQAALATVQGNGDMDAMKAQVERCMAEYDLDGWTVPDLVAPDDVSVPGRKVQSAPAQP